YHFQCDAHAAFMNGDFTVTAPPPPTFPLAVTKQGAGAGTVTSSPPGIDCGATCTASFDAGTEVTLTATPAAGSTFAGWSGDCSGTGACTFTMHAAKAVTATFARRTVPLTVSRGGAGNGGVRSTPPGIDCGATCLATFELGTAVTLTATAAAGSTFTGWSGDCSGKGTCLVTMDAARSVTATFAAKVPLSVALAGTGGGTV